MSKPVARGTLWKSIATVDLLQPSTHHGANLQWGSHASYNRSEPWWCGYSILPVAGLRAVAGWSQGQGDESSWKFLLKKYQCQMSTFEKGGLWGGVCFEGMSESSQGCFWFCRKTLAFDTVHSDFNVRHFWPRLTDDWLFCSGNVAL